MQNCHWDLEHCCLVEHNCLWNTVTSWCKADMGQNSIVHNVVSSPGFTSSLISQHIGLDKLLAAGVALCGLTGGTGVRLTHTKGLGDAGSLLSEHCCRSEMLVECWRQGTLPHAACWLELCFLGDDSCTLWHYCCMELAYIKWGSHLTIKHMGVLYSVVSLFVPETCTIVFKYLWTEKLSVISCGCFPEC